MQDILEALAARSIRLEVCDGKLQAHAAPNAMTQELQRAVLEHKEDLIRYLSAAPTQNLIEEYPEVVAEPAGRYLPFPLNPVQHAYWIGRSDSLALGGTSTHVYVEFDCAPLDVGRLAAALAKVIARHDMLRAVVEIDGRQRVLASVADYLIIEHDLSGLGEQQRAAELQRIRTQMSQQVIPCERWPLFDICVVQLSPAQSRLCMGWDFLTVDAWSLMIVLREWHRFYVDTRYSPAPLTLGFRDYLLTEARCRELPAFEAARRYWLERIDDLPGPPSLPQAPVVVGKRYTLRRRSLRLSQAAWQSLQDRARSQGLTPSNILLAAFAEVLGSWSANQRFCVNLTLFNRLPLHAQVNSIVGDFTNLMLVEIDAAGEGVFVERAARIQEQFLRDMDHRQFGAIEVMREMLHRRRSQQAAAFPIVFTSTLMLDGSRGETSGSLHVFGPMVWGLSQTPQVSLDCQIFDMGGELLVNWDAAEEIFLPGVLDDMFAAYSGLLQALARNTQIWRQEQVVALPPQQCSQRERANATAAPIVDECLHAAFVRQALSRPGGVAVEYANQTLAYGELLAASNRLAQRLIQQGVVRNQLVAICIDRSVEQIVGVMAVLIAGGAYLPIDPRWPALRRSQLLIEGDVRVVLTAAGIELSAELPAGVECVAVEVDGHDEPLRRAPPLRQSPSDLAYVIFTSGSTGKPKGVMIDHRAAVNTVVHVNRLFGVDERDRMLAVSELSFDLSVYDIFGILGAGATLVLPQAAMARDPGHWHALIRGAGVTLWNSAPQLMSVLVDAAGAMEDSRMESLRVVLLSGDWIPVRLPSRLRQLAGNARVVSLGGATEGAIWSIYFPIESPDPSWKSIPYGTPLPNQHMYVFDSRLRPRPDWVAGDIYIGGAGVAAGYWQDPEKTARSFIRHPQTGERLYLTGDKGRYRADGVLEFLGREDHQVKVRGYRVELGEIAATLLSHPQVSDAIVRWVAADGQAKQLVAYVVAATPAAQPDPGVLRKFLEQRLPDYMVPPRYLVLAQLPLTANGKVDVEALPIPSHEVADPGAPVALPRSDSERRIWEAWTEVLGRQSLRIDENFFEVGGDSLRLIDVMNRLNLTQAQPLAVSEMLAYPTIESLAAYLQGATDIRSALRDAPPTPARIAAVRDNDVAIIGMAGRFPDAADVAQLWKNLAAGRCSVRQFTDEELLSAGVSEAEVASPNYVKASPVFPDIDLFDAGYFDLPPAEAAIMDPQQRLLLECASAALDDAGYPGEKYAGRIGVFVGKGTNFYLYEHLIGNQGLALNADMLGVLSLNEPDYAATLVSYKLGLTGPSLSINTACSTSLVAVHTACQSLINNKECEIAVAGGVTLASTVSPSGYTHIEGHITSPDGYCRAFADDANGCVFGSGVGLVVLKPLQRALEDRDGIYAVIKGSAINNDGASKLGFTAPSARGQAGVIADALRQADCSADSIQAVEAHGTGTNLGDPLEIEGLRAVFGGPRGSHERCAIGSIKTNIGHLGSAAGVAGLIKIVQALRHRQLPPSLHATTPSRKINFRDSPFHVNSELREWPAPACGARRAGVSSFGVGGTNAHVIVEEAPEPVPAATSSSDELLVLSARSESALRETARNLAQALQADGSRSLADVAFTLQVGRKAHEWRSAVICRSIETATRLLQPDSLVMCEYQRQHTPQVVLLFSGQGMELSRAVRCWYAQAPAFKAAFDRCAAAFVERAAFDLRELLQAPETTLEDYRQSLSTRQFRGLQFASEFALASLWLALGIKPAALLGVGLGEEVAACIGEGLPLEEALRRLDAANGAINPEQVRSVIERAASVSGSILLSVGPCQELMAGMRSMAIEPSRHVASAGDLRGNENAHEALLDRVSRLWMRGVEIDWRQLHTGRTPRRISLPSYPFERSRHWIPRSATNRVGPAALVRGQQHAATNAPQAVAAPLVQAAPTPVSAEDIQALLEEIWSAVLGVQSVGVNDNFFDLGGNSVMATRVFARVRRELGVELPLSKMFEFATVRQMCLFVAAKRNPDMLERFSEDELQEIWAMTEA